MNLLLGGLLELLDSNGDCSGLKLDVFKRGMWFGKNVNRMDSFFEIKWLQRFICVLGILFVYNFKLCEIDNFVLKIIKLQKFFNIWLWCDFMFGSIIIVKILGLLKLIKCLCLFIGICDWYS